MIILQRGKYVKLSCSHFTSICAFRVSLTCFDGVVFTISPEQQTWIIKCPMSVCVHTHTNTQAAQIYSTREVRVLDQQRCEAKLPQFPLGSLAVT